MWNCKVFIRIIEVLLCAACLVALRVTDDESRRVVHYLRNISREWFQLDNVTWGAIGSALAAATCGGYLIITMGLLIAAITGELRGRKTELFLLGLGVVLFGIVGGLSMASIESVPPALVDNAAVLGALCLVTALVFIADLLMSPPKDKKKHDGTQTFVEKDTAKSQLTPTLMTGKDTKIVVTNGNTKPADDEENRRGTVNDGFERMDETRRHKQFQESERSERESRYQPEDEKDDVQKYGHVEQELREYRRSIENERALRESQRLQKSSHPRDPYERDRRIDETRIIYKGHDIYQRPVDEIDTPPFPMVSVERRAEPIFARLVNPSVKIMRVERDVEDAPDYRHSDSSQYDNVPTKMKGTSPGILKKTRDVSFTMPSPPRSFGNGQDRTKDEIEMLEECFGVLRTTSTGTQTGIRLPSSPTDPGYVRHTASNWPHDRKTKTPGSSPEHTKK